MKKSEWKDNLEIGDFVKIKEGVVCPDFKDLIISGWKGEVREISEDGEGNILICIKWDNETIQNMPKNFIKQGEEEGLENNLMYLLFEDIELIKKSEEEFIKIERTIYKKDYGLETRDKLITICGREMGGHDISSEFKDELWEDMSIDVDELIKEKENRKT